MVSQKAMNGQAGRRRSLGHWCPGTHHPNPNSQPPGSLAVQKRQLSILYKSCSFFSLYIQLNQSWTLKTPKFGGELQNCKQSSGRRQGRVGGKIQQVVGTMAEKARWKQDAYILFSACILLLFYFRPKTIQELATVIWKHRNYVFQRRGKPHQKTSKHVCF